MNKQVVKEEGKTTICLGEKVEFTDLELASIRLLREIGSLNNENKRLNNIIDEFEKILKEEKTRTRYANDVERFTAYDYMLKRLQELKGSDKK